VGVSEYGLEQLVRARLEELRAAAEAERLAARYAPPRRGYLLERATSWLRALRRPQRQAPLTDTPAAR
jgi:hypothetical protein